MGLAHWCRRSQVVPETLRGFPCWPPLEWRARAPRRGNGDSHRSDACAVFVPKLQTSFTPHPTHYLQRGASRAAIEIAVSMQEHCRKPYARVALCPDCCAGRASTVVRRRAPPNCQFPACRPLRAGKSNQAVGLDVSREESRRAAQGALGKWPSALPPSASRSMITTPPPSILQYPVRRASRVSLLMTIFPCPSAQKSRGLFCKL